MGFHPIVWVYHPHILQFIPDPEMGYTPSAKRLEYQCNIVVGMYWYIPIIPTDEHIFQRGRETTKQIGLSMSYKVVPQFVS